VSEYTARAWREDPWWVVEVEGVGATQAKTVDKVDHMARALVSDLLGVPYDEVEVLVDIALPEEVARGVREAKQKSAQAADLTREAARLQRDLVEKLRADQHLSGKEIATVLGVTPGRVSQLTNKSDVSGTKKGRGRRSSRPQYESA
jgi:predicted XRE-type DNA-binding protein